VTWTAVEGSQVRIPRDPLQMMVDLARIARRCRPAALHRAAANLAPTNETVHDGTARAPAGGHPQAV
jgi:hypothetical protein